MAAKKKPKKKAAKKKRPKKKPAKKAARAPARKPKRKPAKKARKRKPAKKARKRKPKAKPRAVKPKPRALRKPAWKELTDEELALKMLDIYFTEVARLGFKRTLALDEVINTYFYSLARVKRKGVELKEIENILKRSKA